MQTNAYILEISVEIMMESCHSLKCKRRIIKSIMDKLRHRFNVSIAEIAYMDSWQRAVLGIVMISNSRKILQAQGHILESLLGEFPDIQVIDIKSNIG